MVEAFFTKLYIPLSPSSNAILRTEPIVFLRLFLNSTQKEYCYREDPMFTTKLKEILIGNSVELYFLKSLL
jgi:hypothetical protein